MSLSSLALLRERIVDVMRFVICVAFVFVAGGALLELCLRLFVTHPFSLGYLSTHPTRHYALTPGYRGDTYGLPLEINSQGMRDEERAVDRQAYRIAVLGDSLTFGQGVTLPALYWKELEQRLRIDSGRAVQVFNFAVPGYNTVAEVSRLHEVERDYDPQLVIFQFTLDDDCISMPSNNLNQSARVRWVKDHLRQLYAYDYLAGRVYGALRPHTKSTPSATRPVIDASGYSNDNPGWKECRDAFAEVAALARSHRQDIVFALFANGALTPPGQPSPRDDRAVRVADALDAVGLTHHLLMDDALRPFSAEETALHVSAFDHHYSARGHKLLGDYLSDYLAAQRLGPAAHPDAD